MSESIGLEAANNVWETCQRHLGDDCIDGRTLAAGISAIESDGGVVVFRLLDGELTLFYYPAEDSVARAENDGQYKRLSLHQNGEVIRTTRVLTSNPNLT